MKAFGAAVSGEIVSATPGGYIATMSKARRTGKLFINYFRNDYGKRNCGLRVRDHPGAPVAVALAWDELKGLKSASAFRVKDVLKRLKIEGLPQYSKRRVFPHGNYLPRSWR